MIGTNNELLGWNVMRSRDRNEDTSAMLRWVGYIGECTFESLFVRRTYVKRSAPFLE